VEVEVEVEVEVMGEAVRAVAEERLMGTVGRSTAPPRAAHLLFAASDRMRVRGW
jgi:hypothetical protein